MLLLNRNDYYLNNKFHLIDGGTSFHAQHHSTDTVHEQNFIPPENPFSVRIF
jgi:hypothetical protein